MSRARSPAQPYDFELSTARFDVYGRDRASLWLDGGIHRVFGGREVRIEAAPGVSTSRRTTRRSRRRCSTSSACLRSRRLLRLGREGRALGRLATALAGFRPPLQPDPFEALVTSVTAQQVSLQSAAAIRSRFIERFGVAVRTRTPSRARARARATEAELIGVGFSTRKAEYVVGLARSDLDLDELASLPDEEVTARLVALRGLGKWTADWFLARHLARPHAWPAGDLGLRKAVTAFYGDVPDVRAFASRFHPFENLSAHYLLTGLRLDPPA